MKNLKSAAALLLALCLSVSVLSGCGSSVGKNYQPGYQPGEPVDVTAITDICRFASGLAADTVVATVDGEKITAGEMVYWIVSDVDDVADYFYNLGMTTENIWALELDPTKEMRQYVMEDALNWAARRALIAANAKRQGVELTDENREDIRMSLVSMTAAAMQDGLDLKLYLWQFALSEEQFTLNCESDYCYSALAQKLFGEHDGQAILDYMETIPVYRTQHILLFTVDPTTGQAVDQAKADAQKALADRLIAQIRASADPVATFFQLQKEYGEDPDLGSFPDGYLAVPGNMVPEYEEASLALGPNEISGVVKSDYGYHIILRLPLGVDPEEYRESYVSSRISEQLTAWAEESEPVTNSSFELLDAKAIYDAICAYRDALTELLAEPGEGDSSSGDASSAGDASSSAPASSAAAASSSAPAASAAK